MNIFLNIKLIVRNWWRNKLFFLISLFSLTAGLGCTNLLMTFFIHEYNVEKYNTDRNLIYLLRQDSPMEEGIKVAYSTSDAATQIKEKYAEKLALENARYLISIFTPSTVMEYTVSFEQLNYIIGWARDYIDSDANDGFALKVKSVLEEFLHSIETYNIEVEGLNSKIKKRKFSLFSDRNKRYEEFGENYSTTYLASFAQLAQAQRHRTLTYEMSMLDEKQFYVPDIIKATRFEEEWIRDMHSIEDLFPQGMLVRVNERGTIENFVLKCTERLCGCAQLEIMKQTNITMKKYFEAVKEKPELYEYLLPYSKGARCTFPGWKCESPCMFGGKGALNRII